MKIYIKTPTDKAVGLETKSSDTIDSIIQKIRDEESISPYPHILVFRGKRLESERTLADYGVQKDSTLIMVPRLLSCKRECGGCGC